MVNNVNIHINNEYYGKQKRTKIIFLQSYGKLFIQLKFTVLPQCRDVWEHPSIKTFPNRGLDYKSWFWAKNVVNNFTFNQNSVSSTTELAVFFYIQKVHFTTKYRKIEPTEPENLIINYVDKWQSKLDVVWGLDMVRTW